MEYFFDYKIRRISGDPEIAQPMLFFERNYRATGLPYSMFAVVDDWIGKQKEHERLVGGDRKALDALKFDELKVRFVPFGANFDDVENSSANEAECNFDEYCSEGCRFKIAADDPSSGTGRIRMFKKGKEVAKFCFAVNLAMRRRVGCRLKRKNDKLVCVLTCKNAKDKFAVAAIGNSGRLPCLDVDRADPTDETKVVDLVSKSRARVVFDLGDSPKDMKFSLTFADAEGCLDAETAKQYYLLDIFENNTVEIVHPKTEFILNYSCPFCHKRMNVDLVKDARYRHGCITCDGAGSVYITNGSGILRETDAQAHTDSGEYTARTQNALQAYAAGKRHTYRDFSTSITTAQSPISIWRWQKRASRFSASTSRARPSANCSRSGKAIGSNIRSRPKIGRTGRRSTRTGRSRSNTANSPV